MKYAIFHEVLQTYQARVREAISHLEAAYGEVNLMRVHEGSIPPSGDIPGLSFHFHGIGCTAQLDGHTVNWDWGRNDTVDQFEAWKIYQMTKDHPEEFGQWADLEALKAELYRLHAEGIVESIEDGSAVYRLASLG
jgi:hypothetical protein